MTTIHCRRCGQALARSDGKYLEIAGQNTKAKTAMPCSCGAIRTWYPAPKRQRARLIGQLVTAMAPAI